MQALQCLNVENASLRVQLESMKVITAAAADASSLHPRDNDAASADAPHSIVDHGMADSPDDTGFLQMVHSTLEEQRAYLGSRSSRLQDYQSHLQHLASGDSGLSAQLDALSRTREAHIRRYAEPKPPPPPHVQPCCLRPNPCSARIV